MSDRICLYCKRQQSQHEGMTFASADLWCPCNVCAKKYGRKRGGTTTVPAQEQPVYVYRRGFKTPRNHDRTRDTE